jgi:putative holliday junction resolvase
MELTNKTYIGLDVGERRIGVGRINEYAKISEALDVINTENTDVIESIKLIISEHQADGIVVGLPRGLDGQETDQTKYCIEFAQSLKSKLSIPVYMIDEAGTSLAADERILKSNEISRDSVAAAILLEDFVSHTNKQELEI